MSGEFVDIVPAKKFENVHPLDQFAHICQEVEEARAELYKLMMDRAVCSPVDGLVLWKLGKELTDIQHSVATMLSVMGFSEWDVQELRREVQEGNKKRGYME